MICTPARRRRGILPPHPDHADGGPGDVQSHFREEEEDPGSSARHVGDLDFDLSRHSLPHHRCTIARGIASAFNVGTLFETRSSAYSLNINRLLK